ncbi:MAG: membrane protein FxsA [Nitratireductor sp.]|nr:membrane protein FxsA [Nitratireductor sp.]
MPFSIIPFLLLVVPILEIATFIVVGGQIGVVATLGMILFTAVLGSILLRIQGFQVLNQLRAATDAGRVPGRELGHGVMILLAGVLLLTPGFVTDTAGFLLFVPFIRNAIWSFLATRITVVGPGMGSGGRESYRRYPQDGVVDLDPDEFSETGTPDPGSPWSRDGNGSSGSENGPRRELPDHDGNKRG